MFILLQGKPPQPSLVSWLLNDMARLTLLLNASIFDQAYHMLVLLTSAEVQQR